MDIFDGIISGFSIALTPMNLVFAFLGAVIGTAVGVLPGLGPAATIALLLPITYSISSPVPAVIMMAGIFYGAMYGGSTTSILLNLPGEAASVVTCYDGHKMAQQGRAGPALGIAAIGSFIAGTVGVIGLTLFGPPIAEFALSFGPPEKFSLALLGLLMAVALSGDSVIKGLIIMVLGLLFAAVGIDPISGKTRFAFGITELQSGFDFVTLAVGVFGLGEIFYNLEQQGSAEIVTTKVGQVFPKMADWVKSRMAILRGTLIGFFIGVIPGGGAVISSLVSYAVEKKISKHPEEFGQGAIEGVAGPESANNAASSSSFIPLLTWASRAMPPSPWFRLSPHQGGDARPIPDRRASKCLLGCDRFHVSRQHHAHHPQLAAGRDLGAGAAGALQHSCARGDPLHVNRVLQHRQSGLRSLHLDRIRCSWLCAS
jgi:putative tricarboxylic transport membrane protein